MITRYRENKYQNKDNIYQIQNKDYDIHKSEAGRIKVKFFYYARLSLYLVLSFGVLQNINDITLKNKRQVLINMLSFLKFWINQVCFSQALNSSNIPIGALGLQLTSSEDEQAHIHDALWVY